MVPQDSATKALVRTKVYNPDTMCGVPRPSAEGAPCKNPKGYRTDHPGWGWCSRHLGSTASGKAFARKEKLRQAVVTYGLPIDIDPEQALLDEVQRTAGHVAWLGQQIRKLDPDLLTWGKTKVSRGRGPQGPVDLTEEAAAVPVLMTLYHTERKHLVSVCTAAINAGISQKALELAQGQASVMVAELGWLVEQVASTLKLSGQRKLTLESLVGQMLHRLASASEGPTLIAGEILDLQPLQAPETDQ